MRTYIAPVCEPFSHTPSPGHLFPGRDSENRWDPNRPFAFVRGGRRDEEKQCIGEASCAPSRYRLVQSPCGDRVYLTYGGPTFGIIYGRVGPNAPKRTLPASPSLSVRSAAARETTRLPRRFTEIRSRENSLRDESVNGYVPVVSSGSLATLFPNLSIARRLGHDSHGIPALGGSLRSFTLAASSLVRDLEPFENTRELVEYQIPPGN